MLTTNPGCCWVSLTCALRLCWFRGAKRVSRPRAGVAKVRLVTRRAHALRPASQHHNFSHILTSRAFQTSTEDKSGMQVGLLDVRHTTV